MNNQEEEQVQLALQGFRNAVRKYCRKLTGNPKDEIPNNIQTIMDHADFCVNTLTKKRRSLQHGLSYLQNDLWPKQILKAFKKEESIRARQIILYHFLEQCLRLHDGLILLISGECRHKGDIDRAKGKKFPSLLQTQDLREDGYTSIYKAKGGYCSYGWDEFHDPLVGIKRRLQDALQNFARKCRKKQRDRVELWESIAESLEARLSHHESEIQLLQQGFKSLSEKVVRDLKSTIAPGSNKNITVSFKLNDKLEKLRFGAISLERQGDAFQVKDPQGALPSGYSKDDWNKIMKLPQHKTTTTKTGTAAAAAAAAAAAKIGNKRRRVILEDSSDDDENTASKAPQANSKQNVKKKKSQQEVKSKKQYTTNKKSTPMTPIEKSSSSGLTVKIAKEKKPQTPGEGTSLSLAKIKVQMGVDQNALEAGREELEKEEAGASKAAKAEEAEAMITSIREGEVSIQRQRRCLTRALNRKGNNKDMNEIWDAREVLRELLMTVGNQILDELEIDDAMSQQDMKRALLVAYKYFQEAGEVVAEQDEYRRRLKSQNIYSKLDDCILSRNLLYLWGNAYTNMGRTSIDLATQTKRNPKSRTEATQHLRNSVKHLEKAVEYAGSLRHRATRDTATWGCNALETAVDALRADQLESLAKRLLGTALWHQGKKKESWQQFKSGSSFFSGAIQKFEEKAGNHDAIHNALCELGVLCLSAHKAYIALAMDELNGLRQGENEEGDLLLSYIQESSKNACDVIDSIYKFLWSIPSEEDWTCEEFLEEKTNIQKTLQDTERWWKTRKSTINRPTAVDTLTTERHSIPLPRSDVEPLGLTSMPTRRFTVDDGVSRRRKKKRRGANPMYHEKSGELLSAVPHIDDSQPGFSETREPKTYRPWGDELLPQLVDEATGRSIPKLEYPCTAPTMPPEMKAFLEAA